MISDDYLDFSDGLLRLTGVDLGSYKRPQMERRIRSFAAAKGGTDSLTVFLGELRGDGPMPSTASSTA